MASGAGRRDPPDRQLQDDLDVLHLVLPGWRGKTWHRSEQGRQWIVLEARPPEGRERVYGVGSTNAESRASLIAQAVMEKVLPMRVAEMGWTIDACRDDDCPGGVLLACEEHQPSTRPTHLWALGPSSPHDTSFGAMGRARSCLTRSGFADALVRDLAVTAETAVDPVAFATAVDARRAQPAERVYVNADEDADREEEAAYEQEQARLEADARALGVPDELIGDVVAAWTEGEEPYA